MGKKFEDIWQETKTFFETHYVNPLDSRLKFKFKQRPDDLTIMRLYKAMLRVALEFETYYKDRPFLLEKFIKNQSEKNKEDEDDDSKGTPAT